MSWPEFRDAYKPARCDARPPSGELLAFLRDSAATQPAAVAAPERWVWTLVDDDGVELILPGIHLVNRLGYFICDVAWPDDAEPFEL